MIHEMIWGMPAHDRDLWNAAGILPGALRSVGREAARWLVQTTNYPWNKIYRTEFLLRHQIRCSNLPVHNDIEMHWRSFLRAEDILSSDRIGVIHVVHEGGTRLTNRNGSERLQIFPQLTLISKEIRATDPKLFQEPFRAFLLMLFAWIEDTLQPQYRDEFRRLAKDFMSKELDLSV